MLHTELVLYDLKHADADAHREGTGLPNGRILENLERILARTNARVWVRVPVIPGFNDSDEAVAEGCRLLRALPRPIEKLSLLPFHSLGAAKYRARGQEYAYDGIPAPAPERMAALRSLVERNGFHAEIGR